jgi:hypothetical protein
MRSSPPAYLIAAALLFTPGEMALADSVTMTWTDTTGTYETVIAITTPTLEDVKVAYANRGKGPPPPPGVTAAPPETPEQFYNRVSTQLVVDVLNYAQTYKQNQAVQTVPPTSIAPAATKKIK